MHALQTSPPLQPPLHCKLSSTGHQVLALAVKFSYLAKPVVGWKGVDMSSPSWKMLEDWLEWQRTNLPILQTPQGMHLLIWLLKHSNEAVPVGELYRSSKASEPTMREAVKQFVDSGLAAIQPHQGDSRRRLIRATPKLDDTVAELRSRLALHGA